MKSKMFNFKALLLIDKSSCESTQTNELTHSPAYPMFALARVSGKSLK